jgi:hypothetical protein
MIITIWRTETCGRGHAAISPSLSASSNGYEYGSRDHLSEAVLGVVLLVLMCYLSSI